MLSLLQTRTHLRCCRCYVATPSKQISHNVEPVNPPRWQQEREEEGGSSVSSVHRLERGCKSLLPRRDIRTIVPYDELVEACRTVLDPWPKKARHQRSPAGCRRRITVVAASRRKQRKQQRQQLHPQPSADQLFRETAVQRIQNPENCYVLDTGPVLAALNPKDNSYAECS